MDDRVIFAIDDANLDSIFLDRFDDNLDYHRVPGDVYYTLPRRDFDRFEDWALSSGYNQGEDYHIVDEAGREIIEGIKMKKPLKETYEKLIKLRQYHLTEGKTDYIDDKEANTDFDNLDDKDINNDGSIDSEDKYLHKKLGAVAKNEAVLNEEESIFYDEDGWNEDALAEIIEALNFAAKIEYELKGGQRGSYGVSGPTVDDLIDTLNELYQELGDAIDSLSSGAEGGF